LAWSELKLGIVGVSALALAAALIFAIGGEGGFWTDKYPLKTRFLNIQGLKPGAVVWLGGKEIGQVSAVEFAGVEVEVTMEVLTEVRPLITSTSTASVGSLSLLGEPIIEIQASVTGTPLGDWAYLQSTGTGGVFGDLTNTASETIQQVGEILTDVRAGRGTLGKLVTDEALYSELTLLMTSAGKVTESINRGEGTMGSLIRDPAAYNALKASLENLQTMTARINSGEGALGRFLNDEAMGNSLANSLTNLEQLTAKASTGEGTMAKLLNDSALHDRLNSTVTRMDTLMARLEAGEGTAGKLLHDQQLYDNMNSAITELNGLLADIRKDPKKYLQVRVSIF
jgi:phospholipid/cholesterol/gamma-HCH transport system substrate-binding protein